MPQQGASRPGRFNSAGLIRRIRFRHKGGTNAWLLHRGIYKHGFTVPLTLDTENYADASTGTDATTKLATTSKADTGTGADSTTKVATTGRADTSTGADALTKSTTLSKADASTGTDNTTKTAAISKSDVGTGGELTTKSLIAGKSDVGSGVDALTATSVTTKNLVDNSAGVDALTKALVTSKSDVGTGTDSVSVSTTEQVSLADSGTGTDSLTKAITVKFADQHGQSGGRAPTQISDATTSVVTISFDDAGSGTDVTYLPGEAPPEPPKPPQVMAGGGVPSGRFARDVSPRRQTKQQQRKSKRPTYTIWFYESGYGYDLLSIQIEVEYVPKTKQLYVSDVLADGNHVHVFDRRLVKVRDFVVPPPPPVVLLESRAADLELIELLTAGVI